MFPEMNRRYLRLAWLLLSAVGCASHEETPMPVPPSCIVQTADAGPAMALRRVVLLPMEHDPTDEQVATRFRNALASEIRATGMFDVVCPTIEEFGCWEPRLLQYGKIPKYMLQDVAARYYADGVLLSRLKEYHPYAPPKIGGAMYVVSVQGGITVGSVDGLWDAREKHVADQAIEYAARLSTSGRTCRPDMIMHTPSQYEKFVAHQMSQALATKAFSPPGIPQLAEAVGFAADTTAPADLELEEIPVNPESEISY